VATFASRLQAMAATYGLVSREQWSDVPLQDVLSTALAPYRVDGGHSVTIEGPSVALKPTAALALGLVAHELATNAVKYGALSDTKGHVSLTWNLDGPDKRKLIIKWRESEGPPVKKPGRKGFGTELIERELKSVLRGNAKIDYAAEGLQAVLSMPLDSTLVSVRAE
jgi:two-component system, chemotaxis family, CheB/CheR fusion protein